MNNELDMLNSLTLPTFVAGKEVKAAQLNTIVEVFRAAIEVLRDRVDFIRHFDNGAEYADEGDIADNISATYKILGFIRDINTNLSNLQNSFTSYTISTNARIGSWSSIYNPNLTNIVDALNNLNSVTANNTASIININNLLDGVTVGVIEDLKADIDKIQQTYATDLELAQEIINLAGVGRTTETIKGNADAIINLNADIQNYLQGLNSKADLVNGTVPMEQLPAGIRNPNKGRYPSLESLESAWPAGSEGLQSGDYAVVGTGDTSEFYSYDAAEARWETSGFSGTVNSVNNVDPDSNGNVTLNTDNITEGVNKYFTDDRVASSPAVIANTAKRSYPLTDENKLATIEENATVGADWNTNLLNIPPNLVYTEDLTAYVLASSLATVATTGSYSDLIDKPTIPSAVSQLVNDSQFVTADTTGLLHYYQSGDIDSFLANKVDKVTGKGLSTEDYTSAEKNKLSTIQSGAQVNDPNTTLQGNTFNGANQLVQLDSLGRLPALDARNLTNLSLSLPLTTKGDILVHNGTELVRLPSGAQGQLLSVDTSSDSGLKYIDNPYNNSPTTLLGLLDTPESYIGHARNILMVSDNESGMEFVSLQEAITGSFTNADLTNGILTINHNLGSAIMPYVITDESNNVMIPNDINFGDGVITVTLTDFIPITGTWKYAFGTRSITDPDVFDRTFYINGVPSDSSGHITIDASTVGALPDTTLIPTATSHLINNSGFITNAVDDLINYPLSSSLHAVALSGSYTDLDNLPTIPTTLAELISDSTHRLVTDTEKATWNAKQEALISGTNIKTINNESLLGSGNITISKVSGYQIQKDGTDGVGIINFKTS